MGTLEERFSAKVRKTQKCWIWLAASTGGKSGDYGVMRVGTEMKYAHRISYELFKRKIPRGLQIDHLCRNRKCVNPEHLEVVTQRENLLRGDGATARNSKKTKCKRGHRFTPSLTYSTNYVFRQCLK